MSGAGHASAQLAAPTRVVADQRIPNTCTPTAAGCAASCPAVSAAATAPTRRRGTATAAASGRRATATVGLAHVVGDVLDADFCDVQRHGGASWHHPVTPRYARGLRQGVYPGTRGVFTSVNGGCLPLSAF